MDTFFTYMRDMLTNKSIRTKILYTLVFLALYRFLVFIPVPFANISQVLNATSWNWGGLEYFAMLLWGTLEQFSIIAVWLIPYINASIILQLLTAVVPKLEELQEQWEQGTQKIQQITRRLSFPLAFLQSIGMVFFINYLLWWWVISTDPVTLLLSAFVLSVGTILLLWIWELITEKGISNGISLLIFASIVAGVTSSIYTYISAAGGDLLWTVIFMVAIVLVLVVLSVLLIKTTKEIPVVYSRQGSNQETATLPIPLNPVGMIPIIFAVAFATFPYLISQLVTNLGSQSAQVTSMAEWIEQNFNIYTEQPGWIIIIVYFLLIVAFTFFYATITFNPEKMADNIQKRGWFVPGIRPWEDTARYFSKVLNHLCLRWGMWLWLIGIYSYILSYIPFIADAARSLGSIPVVVQGAWVIIIVWVVQELINKINSELLMEKYDQF